MPSGAKEPGESLPSDPLVAFGSSLFLQVLSYLQFPDLLSAERVSRRWRDIFQTHRNSIWRAACYRTDLENKDIKQLEEVERRAGPKPTEPIWAGDPEEPELIHPDDIPDPVNWRGTVKGHVELQRGWKWGRALERWITPPGGATWRMKLDPEEGVMISTSRVAETTGRGLHVIDARTCKPLFTVRDVRPWAHLEFAKGFVIFDVGEGDDPFAVQVYRTPPAVWRSSHPPPKRRPAMALSSQSRTHPSWKPTQDYTTDKTPPPRGHLTFYRKIQPPTACIAFRARVDYEDEEGKERAVLATAGDEAIYLWDLDDEKRFEVIQVEHPQMRTRYIEFDEEYVFVCSTYQMLVYRRSSKTRCAAFPRRKSASDCDPSQNLAPRGASPLYFAIPPGQETLIPRRRNLITEHPQAVFGYVEAAFQPESASTVNQPAPAGHRRTRATRPQGNVYQTWLNGQEDEVFDFSACHYTSKDLFCASGSGVLVIVRDYRDVFGQETVSAEEVDTRSIWIDLGEPIRLLSAQGEHVVAVTKNHIYVLDTAHLPTLPLSSQATGARAPESAQDSVPDSVPASVPDSMPDSASASAPDSVPESSPASTAAHTTPPATIRINSILSAHPAGLEIASCVQMDRSSIFITYFAQGERTVGGVFDPETNVVRPVPAAAVNGFGLCVKVWEFAT